MTHWHNEALVITLLIANYQVKWILVNPRNYTGILFLNTLNKMQIMLSQRSGSSNTLVWFREEAMHAKGKVSLLVSIGPSTLMISFLIVNMVYPYNTILRKKQINNMRLCHQLFIKKILFSIAHRMEILGN